MDKAQLFAWGSSEKVGERVWIFNDCRMLKTFGGLSAGALVKKIYIDYSWKEMTIFAKDGTPSKFPIQAGEWFMPLCQDAPVNATESGAMLSRHRISTSHPVIGSGYRMLGENEMVQPGDQTACVSELLSMDGCKWADLTLVDGVFGQTVGCLLDPAAGDADCHERIFRRPRPAGFAS